MLQRCTAGSSSTSLGTPVAGGASLSPHPTESLTLSPRSPRFPGTPCGGQERGAQEGITQTRVQLRKGGTYCWPTIPLWPWASILTLQGGRDMRRVLGAPQHHPRAGTAATLAQRPVRHREPSCPWLWGHGGTVAVPTRGPGSPRSPLAPGSPAPGAPCQRKARTHPHPHCPQLLPALPGTPHARDTPQSPPALWVPCATIQSGLSTLRGELAAGTLHKGSSLPHLML